MSGWSSFLILERGGEYESFLFSIDIMKELIFWLKFCDCMDVYRWITQDWYKALNTVDFLKCLSVAIRDWIFTIENCWSHSPDLLCRCCWSPGNLWCCGWGSLFPGSVADGGGLACWVPQDSDSLRLWHCTLSAHCHLETKIYHVWTAGTWNVIFATLEICGLAPIVPCRPLTLCSLCLYHYEEK